MFEEEEEEEERKETQRQVRNLTFHHHHHQQQQQEANQQSSVAQQQQSATTTAATTTQTVSQDIANWWPVFGRKSNGSSTTFWGKNPKKLTLDALEASDTIEQLETQLNKEDLDERETNTQEAQTSLAGSEIHSMFVNLTRFNKIIRALKMKNYLYGVRGSWLVYYKEENEKEPFRGCLRLCSDVIIEKKILQKVNPKIHYIEFIKDGNVRMLFSENQAVVQQLYEAIRQKCVLQNFQGNYKKLELLGSGSYAVVYKVKRATDGKIFAAKIITKEKLEGSKDKDKLVAMLINEYKMLRESHYKNVIKMEEIYQDDSQLVFIMEFLQEEEIYSRLRQVKHLTHEAAAEMMENLTQDLYNIHLQITEDSETQEKEKQHNSAEKERLNEKNEKNEEFTEKA